VTFPKVLLVYPNIWSDVFPLSIMTLSAVLKRQGAEVEVFSALQRRSVNAADFAASATGDEAALMSQFRQRLQQFQPDILAFSVVEDAYPIAIRLLESVPDYSGFILMGGVFPTFAPEMVIAHPAVKAICIGEGEQPFMQLCSNFAEGKLADDVPGLWVKRTDGSVRKNPKPELQNLDDLPAPDYSVLDRSHYHGPVPLIAHRGCPYPCTFCNSPAQAKLFQETSNKPFFRKHSIASLQRDLEVLTVAHADKLSNAGIYFCSDTLLAWSGREFDAFIELYSDYKIPFICHTTAETITEDRIKKLVSVGLKLMNVGVQHGNEQFRREVLKRSMPNQELIKRFEIASAQGAWISADFIMGFPLETPELARETIVFSRAIKARVKNCSVFVPYHGTELRRLAVQKGYLQADELAVWNPEQSQLNMPQFPKHEIARLMAEFRSKPNYASLAATSSVDC